MLEEMFRNDLRVKHRRLRDGSNPFELPEASFIKLFRLNKETAMEVYNFLNNFLPISRRSTYVPNHLKVLLTLNFYAYGSYQTGTGTNYNMATSQPTVSRIISTVTEAICTHLVPEKIKFPTSEVKVQSVKQGFLEKFNFPGVLGCIDCTHVAIIHPPLEDELYPGAVYYNRKGYTSLNVQIICDSQLIITAINARYPGSTHDAAIWQMSNIKDHMRREFIQGRNNTWLLGDSGYPLQPWLMTPIINAAENTPEGAYTRRHASTRNFVERVNGVLKARFRCLLKHRVLHYKSTKAGKIIYACAALHNICINRNIDFEGNLEENVAEFENPAAAYENNENNLLVQSVRIRQMLIRNHFN